MTRYLSKQSIQRVYRNTVRWILLDTDIYFLVQVAVSTVVGRL